MTKPKIEIEEKYSYEIPSDEVPSEYLKEAAGDFLVGIQTIVEEFYLENAAEYPDEHDEDSYENFLEGLAQKRTILRIIHQALSYQLGCIEATGCLIGWDHENRRSGFETFLKAGKSSILQKHDEGAGGEGCDCERSQLLWSEINPN